jgi:hypothetical protein
LNPNKSHESTCREDIPPRFRGDGTFEYAKTPPTFIINLSE